MKFGVHISINVAKTGGIAFAPVTAQKMGCEVFQMFSRSPQGGKAPELTPEIVDGFRAALKETKIPRHYIHTPYYINFASTNPRIKYGSISVVRSELERGSLLGTHTVMTHIGTAREVGRAKAVAMAIEGMCKVLKGYSGSTFLALELAAGSGEVLAATFEEMNKILSGVRKKIRHAPIGVCLDTAHVFASGYDLRTPEAVDATLTAFGKVIGLDALRVIHSNDSLADLGEKKDRHAHLGKGKIGLEGFEALVQDSRLREIDLILETPHDPQIRHDLRFLKSFRP
jgi:deoxyribonuclease-4